MGHQDGIEPRKIFPDGSQPLCQFAPSDPGIDQDARSFCREKRRVTRAARRQNTDLNDAAPFV